MTLKAALEKYEYDYTQGWSPSDMARMKADLEAVGFGYRAALADVKALAIPASYGSGVRQIIEPKEVEELEK